MKNKLILITVVGVLLSGCLPGLNRSGVVVPEVIPTPTYAENGKDNREEFFYRGASDYTKQSFDKARAEGKIVMLYFHANWCPTCRQQQPINEAAFIKLGNKVVVFVANFNDSETTKEDGQLARDKKIYYQHSYVLFNRSGEEVYRHLGALTEEQIVAEVEKVD